LVKNELRIGWLVFRPVTTSQSWFRRPDLVPTSSSSSVPCCAVLFVIVLIQSLHVYDSSLLKVSDVRRAKG